MSAASAPMSPDELALRLHQQHLVASFGLYALSNGTIQPLLDEATRIAAEGLETQFAKVGRYRDECGDLLIVAGVGWHAGVVGQSTLGGGLDSPAGFTLHTGQPTMANHLAQEQRFRTPALLIEHGVQSAINVIIGHADQNPFGILEADSTQRNQFIEADTAFLQAIANILAAGLVRAASEDAKDAALRDKDMLMREVHHRVTNSLQLVRTMLALQSRTASDETRGQLDVAAGRIMSIAAVHRRLYQGGSVAEGDAAAYLRALIDDIGEVLNDDASGRTIVLEAEPMMLPADKLTPLGLIVTELVTNAIKYGEGRVDVGVSMRDGAIRVVAEDQGRGFGPAFEPRTGQGLGMRLIATLAKLPPAQAIRIDPAAKHGRVVVTIKP